MWILVAGATVASYFVDYHFPPGHPPLSSNFTSLHAVATLVTYVLKYLGASVAGFDSTASTVAGGAAVAAFGLLAGSRWALRQTSGFIFPAAIGLNAVADAIMTSLGRAGIGTDQAMSSRYMTISMPLWIAIGLLAVLYLTTRPAARATAAGSVVAAAAAIVVMTMLHANGIKQYSGGAGRMRQLRVLREALYDGTDLSALTRLYPDPTLVRERRRLLQMLHMSVFRDH